MKIRYANQKVEKFFSDYVKMQKKIPYEWVRTIKSIWIDLGLLNALVTFWHWV